MADVVIKVVGQSDSAEIDRLIKSIEGLGPQIVEAMRDVKPAAEEASKAVKDVGDEGERSGGKLGKLGGMLGSLGKAALVGGAALGVAAVGAAVVAKELIGSAEAMGDAQAKVDIALGSSADRVTEFVNTANSLGMTKTQFLEVAGGLGQLATSLGVTQGKAASMAANFTEIGPKLAAFAGVEKEVASDALEKALMGKTKGLAALGIAITDADIKAAAMREGVKGEAKDWTEAQIAQVNYAAVMEKTKDAQAAWADNSGDVDVSMQRVTAAIEDAKAALGEKLLPIIAPIASAFAEKLPGAIDTLMGIIGPAFDAIGAGADAVMGYVASLRSAWENDWGGIRSSVAAVVDWWNSTVAPAVAAAVDAISGTMGGFEGDWGSTWATIEGYVKTFLDWWDANVEPTIAVVVAGIKSVLGGLATWWKSNSDTIIAVLSAAWSAITNIFSAAFDLIKGIVTAALALIRGDFSGATAAIQEAVGSAVPKIVAAFFKIVEGIANVIVLLATNIVPAVKGVFVTVLSTIANVLAGGVSIVIGAVKGLMNALISGAKSALGIASPSKVFAAIGTAIVDGIRNALVSTWDGLVAKLKALVDLLPETVRKLLGIASPSTVFKELGEWIVLGLASGIQKADFAAISALSDVIGKMNTVIQGAQDFAKKLIDFTVPSTDDIRAAKGKFLQLLIIMQDFAKGYAYLGSMLPVANTDQASALQQKIVQIKIDELAAKFREIKELQGLKVKDLLTGGEADWAGKLNNMIGSMASAWGSLADNLTKMANAKFPSAAQLDAIKLAALGILFWTADVIKAGSMPAVLGVEDFAAVLKAAADALNSIAGLKLADITAVTADQLDIAKANIERVGLAAWGLVTGWVKTAGDAKARAAWITDLQDFNATVGAASSILKAGDLGDLSKLAAVTVDQLAILKANINAAGGLAWELVTGWAKTAGKPEARAAWLADLKDYADTLAAAVGIFKAGADASAPLTDITRAAWADLETIRDNVIDIGLMVQELVKWTFTWPVTFKEWVDNLKAAIDLFRAGADASGALAIVSRVTGAALDTVRENVIDIGSMVQELVKWTFDWPKDFKTWADNVKIALDIFKGGVDASGEVGKLTYVLAETLDVAKVNVIMIAAMVQELARWTFDFGEGFKAWAENAKVALDIFKAGVDASAEVGTLTYVLAETLDAVKMNIINIAAMVQELVKWTFDWPKDFKDWAENVKTALAVFGAFVGMATAIETLGKVALSAKTGDVIASVMGQARLLFDAIFGPTGLIKGISTEAATSAAAAMGALESGANALSAVGDAIMTMLDNPFVDNPRRPRNSSVMRGAAKTRIQAMADNLREGIKLAITTIQAALKDVTIDTTKLDALNALGEAFSSLASALKELSSKDIDLKRITQALAGIPLLGTAGGGAGGGGGVGGGSGPLTINAGSVTLANPTLNFPPLTATVNSTVSVQWVVNGRVIDEIVRLVDQRMADRAMLGVSGP